MKDEIRLEDAIAALREDEAPPAANEAAAARAWARVALEAAPAASAGATIRGCADVLALLPAHGQGALQGARALLVEDHLHECASCRSAQRGGPRLAILPWRAAAPAGKPAPSRSRRYALAAAALLSTGLAAFAVQRAFFDVPSGSRGAVQSVGGVLQRVTADGAPALQPGAEIFEAEAVRTARGSRAHLKLRDGSVVEMGERAELSLHARGNDTTIRLERGSVIVQAAKRRSGRLLVVSKDCTVQVTGTVFSVSSALKGSRVSVIEGQVRVAGAGEQRLLQPGEQWATSAAMGSVPVRDEIAWSRDLDHHLALLGELKGLREQLAAIETPGLRYRSRLLGALPEGTVVFASLPNYGQALGEAHRLFQERLQQSAVLREWWRKADPARHGGPSLDRVIETVRSFAEFLGDEVAFAAVMDASPRGPQPFLLAELRRQGLREFIESELRARMPSGGPPLQVLDPAALAAPVEAAPGVYVLLLADLVAVSGDREGLRAFVAPLPGEGGFERTAFGQRVAEAYQDGVGLLFAADLQRIAQSIQEQRPLGSREAARFHDSGMDDLKHLVVERKQLLGQSRMGAVLAFSGPRRGVASWLAAPGPMGALDFLSPSAQLAAAFLSKSPALVLDDVLGLANGGGDGAERGLAELQSKLDLRLKEDIAETLGGELALALDGPLLPTPAWKLVVEVKDAARLQRSLQALVGKANEEAESAGRAVLRLEAEQVGAQTYHSLRGEQLPVEVHYTFADGYLVAGPSRALVMQALRRRETGESLARSAAFVELLPPGRQDHVSGLVYQNLGAAFGALPGWGGPLTDAQRRSLHALGRDSRPGLLCAFGEVDGIQVAGVGGGLDFDPANLALPLLLERAFERAAPRAAP